MGMSFQRVIVLDHVYVCGFIRVDFSPGGDQPSVNVFSAEGGVFAVDETVSEMMSLLVHLVGRVQALLEKSRLRVFSNDLAFVEMPDESGPSSLFNAVPRSSLC